MKGFVLFGFTFVLAAVAETNTSTTVTTNWVKARHKLRVVDGQLYDSEKSYKWEMLTKVRYVEPFPNGAVFRRFEKVTDTVSTEIDPHLASRVNREQSAEPPPPAAANNQATS